MAHRKRRTVWKDALTGIKTLAATTVANDVILAESDIEELGEVTITRIVGSFIYSYPSGTSNELRGAIWVSPQYAGIANPSTIDADFFERSRVMWTMSDMVDFNDDIRRISFDIRTMRKVKSGVGMDFLLENASAAILTYSLHTRTLLKLA